MKKIILLLAFVFLLIPFVASADWDNKVLYEKGSNGNPDLKVKLTNSFLGLFPTGEIGTAELKSHKSVDEVINIGTDSEVTIYFQLSNFNENYKDGLGKVTFMNIKTGKEVQKSYEWVYLTKEVIVNNNGTGYEINKWISYNSKDIPNKNITLGIKINNLFYGEYLDIFPELAGKKLNKWARVYVVDLIKSGGATSSETGYTGAQFSPKVDLQVINFSVDASTTRAYLFFNNNTQIANTTIIANVATFSPSVPLLAGHIYYAIVDAEGASYTKTYTTGNSYNISRTNIIITGGVNGGTSLPTSSDVLANINYITTFTGFDTPTIVLNSPTDNYNQTGSAITFNATISDLVPNNVTLFLNGVANETNSSGILGEYIFNKNLAEGTYNWTVQSCGTEGCGNATSRILIIDSTIPEISISSPSGTFNYLSQNYNFTLNFTVTDNHLGTCKFEYNGTNNTISCSNATLRTVYFNYSKDMNNLTVYANDTSGNEKSEVVTWGYKIFENNLTYNTPVLAGSDNEFTLNVTRNPSYSITIPYLNYNGTLYSTTPTLTGNNYYLTKTLTAPLVTTDQNVTFEWNLLLNDATYSNSSSYIQSINNLTIDGCQVNSINIFNFTLYDEITQDKINDVKIDYTFNLYNFQRTTELLNLSNSSGNNPTLICISNPLPSGTRYSLDGVLKFKGNNTNESYIDARYYNLLNFSLSNSTVPQNISLYDINSSIGIPFQLTFRDENLVLSPNILVNVQKQYVEDGIYRTVEVPITDSNGQTILNLVRNTAVYNFIMIDITGNVVGSFNKVTAFCQDYTIGSCSIELNTNPTTTETFNFSEDIGVSYSLGYSKNSKVITLTFNSLNSSILNTRLLVQSENQFENKTICDFSLVTTTGSITCNATTAAQTNNFLYATIYVNGAFVATQSIFLASNDLGGLFGSEGIFIAFLLILAIICMFASDKQVLTIMLGVGWVTVLALGLIKGALFGTTQNVVGGIWLVITIIIFIWRLKEENS